MTAKLLLSVHNLHVLLEQIGLSPPDFKIGEEDVTIESVLETSETLYNHISTAIFGEKKAFGPSALVEAKKQYQA